MRYRSLQASDQIILGLFAKRNARSRAGFLLTAAEDSARVELGLQGPCMTNQTWPGQHLNPLAGLFLPRRDSAVAAGASSYMAARGIAGNRQEESTAISESRKATGTARAEVV